MKKLLLVTIVLLMTQLCACSDKTDNNTEAVKDNKSLEIQEIAIPNVEIQYIQDTGSDNNYAFESRVNPSLDYIDISFVRLIGQDVFDEWVEDVNSCENISLQNSVNMYSLIHKFNISDDFVIEFYHHQRDYCSENECLTDEEIDLLLSDDYVAVADHFVSDYAIAKDGNIYSPKWLYEHSIQDYIDNDLPLDVVKEKINKIDSELAFSIDTREAIKLKLDAIDQYIEAKGNGYKVSFKSAPNISNIDLSEPFDATSDTNQLFGIEKDGKKYGLRWIVGKDISEYENVGITTDELKALLDKISDYKDTEEYGWIESCYNKMLQNNGIDIKQPDDCFGNYIYTVNGADCNVEWLCRNSVEEWEDFGLTAKDVEKILSDLSEYKDTDEYKIIEDKYKEMNK